MTVTAPLPRLALAPADLAHPHPAGYPWWEPPRSGVLTPAGLRARPHGAEDLSERFPVVAVGSNAAPAVLARKLGTHLHRGLPVVRAVVHGLGIGHSAHASAGGYVAAAPFVAAGGLASDVVVTWLDEAQLQLVDRTEPNYRRVLLPAGTTCRTEDGTVLAGAQVYDSRHGLLADAGRPLALAPQQQVVSWLARRLPDPHAAALAGDDPHGWLRRPATRRGLPRLLRAGRLTRRSGLA